MSFCMPLGSVGLHYLRDHLAIKYAYEERQNAKKSWNLQQFSIPETTPEEGPEGVVCIVLSVILTAGGANRHIPRR